ncbi:M23 family metallopeptidase [Candidatus Woesebacteria bacterium]|nr:M23 family metallopeptidase [Candidatus Woesebacteria bacterium]
MLPRNRSFGKAASFFLLLGCLVLLSFFVNGFNNGGTKLDIETVSTQYASVFGLPVSNPWEYDFGNKGYDYLSWSTEGNAYHPGIDVNALSGRDLGDPVFSIADGFVTYAQDSHQSYGNLVVIEHTLPDNSKVCSAYAHLDTITVGIGGVGRGVKIGTIGKSGGQEHDHLHWEIRTVCGSPTSWPSGLSPAQIEEKYVNPLKFVQDFTYYSQVADKVVVFEDSYFRGSSENYWPGYTNMVDFESALDNKVSSVAIPPGWMVNLYDQPGQSANAEVFNADVRLSDNSLSSGGTIDNKTSAIKVSTSQQCTPGLLSAASAAQASWVASSCNPDPAPAPPPAPAPQPGNTPNDPSKKLVLCRGESFTNCQYEFNVGQYSVLHQEYRSISVPAGWSFILKDWGDSHESCYNQSLQKLGDHESWQFKIGQITVIDSNVCTSGGGYNPGPLGNSVVRFWSGTSFTGEYMPLNFTDEANTYWLHDLNFSSWGGPNLNDTVESFELNTQTANRSMALYRDAELQGPAKCFTGSADNLWSYKFNDGNDIGNQASSVRFFVGQGCDLRPQVPSEIWVHYADKGKVVLTWPWGGPDDDGYRIYLFDGSTYQRVATVGRPDAQKNAKDLGLGEYLRSWTYTPVSCGQQLSFAVSAWNEFGESAMTHSVTAYVPECDCTDIKQDGVVLFEEAYCSGSKIEIPEAGRVSLINFNDQTSSVHIAPGWSVEVFENNDSSDGLATCLTGDKWDLSLDSYWPTGEKIGGTVSNLSAFHDPSCGRQLPVVECDAIDFDGVALFDYEYCFGSDRLFNQPGFYNLYDFDNQTSAIYVKDGWSVRVWEQNTRQGQFVCFNGPKWNLSLDPYWVTENNTNNNITSIEIYSDTLCGGVNPPVLFSPTDQYTVTQDTDLTLHWQQDFNSGYWAELWGPDGFFRSSGSLGIPEWRLGFLPAGIYTWRVRSENFSILSDWSELEFEVLPVHVKSHLNIDVSAIARVVTVVAQGCVSDVQIGWGDGNTESASCGNAVANAEHTYALLPVAANYFLSITDIDGSPIIFDVMISANVVEATGCDLLSNPTTGVEFWLEKDCGAPGVTVGIEFKDDLYFDYNDSVSSVAVAPGWSVRAWSGLGYTGMTACFSQDMWDLSKDKYDGGDVVIDNTISSYQVFQNPSCYAPPPPVAQPITPTVPTNLFPTGGEYDVGASILLVWSEAQFASHYKVEFSNGSISETAVVSKTATSNGVMQLYYAAVNPGSYSWKVKAISGTLESAWSNSMHFTVKKPVIVKPPENKKIYLPIVSR